MKKYVIKYHKKSEPKYTLDMPGEFDLYTAISEAKRLNSEYPDCHHWAEYLKTKRKK